MGKIKQLMGKLIDGTTWRFILVGIANTIFGTSVMFLLYNLLHAGYWFSSAMNYILGSILSYFLNKHFTFKNHERSFGQIVRFVVNIAACYFIAYGVARPLARKICAGMSDKWQDNIAMAAGMCFFVGLNYLGQKFFVFRYENQSPKSDSDNSDAVDNNKLP